MAAIIDELGSIVLAFLAGLCFTAIVLLGNSGWGSIIITLLGFICGCGFMYSVLTEIERKKMKEVEKEKDGVK